jgi:dihydrofolate synthase/folylpolyglutamate synthase
MGWAQSFLEGLSPSAVRLGLDRVQTALRALRNPEREFPSVHVAGTNGKGSTCAFLAASLKAQGYKVGLYTSPHLHTVNERFRIGGEPISQALLEDRIHEVVSAYPALLEEPAPLTYFEVGTLVAFWHFARERVDVAVLETGLGGRLDATNVVRPLVTAVTPVSLDHMDYLGHTLSAIAGEKAGIIKHGVPVVLGRQAPDAQAVLEERARQKGAPVRLLGRDFTLEPAADGQSHTWRGARSTVTGLRPGLRGPHQLDNAAVALACLEALEDRGLGCSAQSAREGISATRWPGRLESLGGTPELVLDGAHNPQGAQALSAALDAVYPGRRVHLVFGVLGDKDHRPMLRALFGRCASAHLCPVDSPRTLPPARYAQEARALCPEVELYGSAAQALAGARMRAAPGDLVVCTGSLFLVGEVRALAGAPCGT